MEQEVVTQVVGLGGSTDFSIMQLFIRADFVVKAVIVILVAASVYSWALIFEKYLLQGLSLCLQNYYKNFLLI